MKSKCCLRLTRCWANGSFSSSLASRPSWICRKTACQRWSGAVVNRTVEYRSRRHGRLWGYAAKVYWHKPTDYPVQQRRGNCTLFLPSGEDGFGQSPKSGQGTSPLWGMGQGPKVLKPLISAIFKVRLSLFFRLRFFIDYLTLPSITILFIK